VVQLLNEADHGPYYPLNAQHAPEEMTMYKTTGISSDGAASVTQPQRGAPAGAADTSSWYGKVARAWGAALDRQADRTVHLAQQLNAGDDSPGTALQVSAAAHQLAFLSTAASTAATSIGQALETLGRKQ
jgi:hypothetical protein